MTADWKNLLEIARAEVEETIAAMPADLRPHAEGLPVVYERQPSATLVADGWDEDLLGMFVGDSLDVAAGDASPLPRQILLFLECLWDFSEGDPEIYREEVHVTYVHEFGHYLGLDEDQLEERGLL